MKQKLKTKKPEIKLLKFEKKFSEKTPKNLGFSDQFSSLDVTALVSWLVGA